ncbi:MAG: pseudaminic acid cytidylyltransferase [Thiobacillaceae bacterium]
MRLCVIPARGGSKRIPRKNIRPFCGKPMLLYAIEKAQQSGLFDAIWLSSDDAEVLALGKQHGVTPLARPAALADDHTPTVPVIAHAIEVFNRQGGLAEQVCCLYPAVPFLQIGDLRAGLKLLERHRADYVFPVTLFPAAIQRALRLHNDGRVSPFYPQFVAARTQDLEAAYHDAGQFYWGRAEAWLEGRQVHLYGHGLVIPNWRVVDIDTVEDWQRAELIYRALMAKGGA